MPSIALITGATAGFGKSCAVIFAQHGYDVIITGRRTERLLDLAAELENKYNVAVLPLAFDIRSEKEVLEAVNKLPENWKQIDVLVNNAGLALGRDYFEEASTEDWDTMIDTNIKGLLYMGKAVAALMAARKKGHIINMGSIAGREIYEKGNVYCATKFAVDAISRSMRTDLLRHGIKVTCINPGAAETEFSLVRFKGDESTAASVYKGMKPLTGDDVAEVVYYTTTLPAHVCINDLTVTCLQQASTMYYHRDPA